MTKRNIPDTPKTPYEVVTWDVNGSFENLMTLASASGQVEEFVKAHERMHEKGTRFFIISNNIGNLTLHAIVSEINSNAFSEEDTVRDTQVARLEKIIPQEHILVPQDTSERKPSPIMASRALNLAGVQPHKAIHLGDVDSEDGAMADQIGMQYYPLDHSDAPLFVPKLFTSLGMLQ
jgi:histidinol phosphatase-like enzyme